MIEAIRARAGFERLARHGTRIRRSELWCTWCPEPESTSTAVAFAIGRAFGTAVERNRMRRRLRAALQELERAGRLSSGLLLIGAGRGANELTFDQLVEELSLLLSASAPPAPTPSGETTAVESRP